MKTEILLTGKDIKHNKRKKNKIMMLNKKSNKKKDMQMKEYKRLELETKKINQEYKNKKREQD